MSDRGAASTVLRALGVFLSVLLWLFSFLLVVPYGIRPRQALSAAGLLLAFSVPGSWTSNAAFAFLTIFSFWIGVLVLGISSFVMLHCLPSSRRLRRSVVGVDVVVVLGMLMLGIKQTLDWGIPLW